MSDKTLGAYERHEIRAVNVDGRPYCPADSGEFACSREAGHAGPHVAATCDVQNSICEVWNQDERQEKHNPAHDIDWQVVAEQHEAALAAMTEDRDRVLDLVRDADMGRDLAVERAEKAERERDEARGALRARLGVRAEPRPLTPDAMTARELLDAAWEAAHAPADGMIPAGAEYITRNRAGGLRGPFTEGGTTPDTDPTGFVTRRLLDPPAPGHADRLRALLDAYDDQDPDSLAYEDRLSVYLARHGARVEGDR